MSKIKLFSLIFVLAMTMLAASCSEKDQDVMPSSVDTGFDFEDFDTSPDPLRVHNPKEDNSSIQLQFDSANYAHHFRDGYDDYFYVNQVNSSHSGFNLYYGKWQSSNVVYDLVVLYDKIRKITTINMNYRSSMVFFYQLNATNTARYHVGGYAYLNCGNYPKKARSMDITWVKGGF